MVRELGLGSVVHIAYCWILAQDPTGELFASFDSDNPVAVDLYLRRETKQEALIACIVIPRYNTPRICS